MSEPGTEKDDMVSDQSSSKFYFNLVIHWHYGETGSRTRRFNTVLVWKLDRWGRSVIDSIKSIQELVSLGIRFLAFTQNIDTDESNPKNMFFLHVMSAFAEMEVSLIRERTIAGIRVARGIGKTLGRPKRIFRRGEVVRLRDEEGLSWRAIAKELKIPVMTAVDAYLSLSTTQGIASSPYWPPYGGMHLYS
jgi:DNA invertase Pin-like site-specific DNA recombinase